MTKKENRSREKATPKRQRVPTLPPMLAFPTDEPAPSEKEEASPVAPVPQLPDKVDGYAWASWWFLQALGWVYLFAFLSIWSQMIPLFGEEGLLPIQNIVRAWQAYAGREQLGWSVYRMFPTLAWFNPSDQGLRWLCGAGLLGSVMLILRIAPRYTLFALWILHLSLVRAGRVFYAYQWDNLLLEAGFLAIWLAPKSLYPGFFRLSEPPRIARWLLYWLLFRLMFFSGVAKIQSGDSTWRNFTALSYHYETQPLPTLFAWYAHRLPLWFHKMSALIMFFIELIVPFGIFSLALRRVTAMFFGLLMLMIGLHGNYGYFGILTCAISLLLLDDRFFSELLPRSLQQRYLVEVAPQTSILSRSSLMFVAALILVVSGLQSLSRAWKEIDAPLQTMPVLSWVRSFRSINRYHLFPVMTTRRPEIMIEGSVDGKVWKPYRFRYKPDLPEKTPRFAFFHMPRLDWQLWFAALSPRRRHRWLHTFLLQLRVNHPNALALLGNNPFPQKPPRHVRAVLKDCHFSDPSERNQQQVWWSCIPLRTLITK
ncbi:MAG: lipase maturation factor family protein [Myxococcales bacterium]|nr:lipase maturation factor family protein [Myxococcales bacterium]